MKIKVFVTPRVRVLHPASVTVKNALHNMGYGLIKDFQLGRYCEIELKDEEDGEKIATELRTKADPIFYNAHIEDCRIEVEK